MKKSIRKHKKREYHFFPPDGSKLQRGYCYTFTRMSTLMRFLTANLDETINGSVDLQENSFGGFGTTKMWAVWYNQEAHNQGAKIKAVLRRIAMRDKWQRKSRKISKINKKYRAFSDKVISLMERIEDENGNIQPHDAKRLVMLFYKRGYKDFEPSEEEWRYINGHMSDGIDFYHWSDRCDWLRTKTVIEYFKRKNLIN